MKIKEVIREVSGALSIPPVGRQILIALSSSRRGLFAKDIVKRIKRSERAVKLHLKSLHRSGLVSRKKARTKSGRTAYLYTFPKVSDFLRSARLELLRRARRLKNLW